MSALSRGSVLPVRVGRVVDGDTVRVRRTGLLARLFRRGDIVVRLYAIDAPESDQRHGSASTACLVKLLRGSALRLEVMDKDRYGRVVGLLYFPADGRDASANLRMVEQGWAFAYTQYGGTELGMPAAERAATAASRGMWKDSRIRRGLDRPWTHRSGQRAALARRRRFSLIFALLALLAVAGAAAYGWLVYL